MGDSEVASDHSLPFALRPCIQAASTRPIQRASWRVMQMLPGDGARCGERRGPGSVGERGMEGDLPESGGRHSSPARLTAAQPLDASPRDQDDWRGCCDLPPPQLADRAQCLVDLLRRGEEAWGQARVPRNVGRDAGDDAPLAQPRHHLLRGQAVDFETDDPRG